MLLSPESRISSRLLLSLALVLVLSTASWAQRGGSIWNSSTGSTIRVLLHEQAPEHRRWEIRVTAPSRKSQTYFGRSIPGGGGFVYSSDGKTVRAKLVGPNEIQVTGDEFGMRFRWTRRGAQTSYPVPAGERAESSVWQDKGGTRFVLLKNDQAVSWTLLLNNEATSYPSRWVVKPSIFEYKKPGGGHESVTLLSGGRIKMGQRDLTLVEPKTVTDERPSNSEVPPKKNPSRCRSPH